MAACLHKTSPRPLHGPPSSPIYQTRMHVHVLAQPDKGDPPRWFVLVGIGITALAGGAYFAPQLLPSAFQAGTVGRQGLYQHPTNRVRVRDMAALRVGAEAADDGGVEAGVEAGWGHSNDKPAPKRALLAAAADATRSVQPADARAISHKDSVVEFWSSRCDIIRRSNRHSPECNHTLGSASVGRLITEPPAPCLVTGLGRSGTSFTSHLLHNLGWEINHDNRQDYCPCLHFFFSFSCDVLL